MLEILSPRIAGLADDNVTNSNAAVMADRGIAWLAAGDFHSALPSLQAALHLGDSRRETLLNLAIAEDRAGSGDVAAHLLAQLVTAYPEWDEPVLRQAEMARRANRQDDALCLYQRVLDLQPRRPEALVSLAALHMQRGNPHAAQMLLVRAAGIAPDRAEVWDGLGIALMLGGDPRAAESAFDRAQNLAPLDVGIALRRAESALAAGDGAGELRRVSTLSAADPCNVALLTEQGALLRSAGALDEAMGVLEAAAALAPDDSLVLRQFGEVLLSLNRVSAAACVLGQALALTPDDAALRNNHAAALIRLQRFAEARTTLEQLVNEQGESVGVLSNLANAQVSLGDQEAGLQSALRATALAPDSGLAWRAAANALAYHPDVTGATMLEAQRCASRLVDRTCVQDLPQRAASTRLRIGLLSATLKTHPVGWLTVAAFEALDSQAFDLICFGQTPSADAMQRRFASVASQWVVVAGQPPARVAQTIREAGIDVLIDMGGFGDLGMMAACAHRAAPVQVKWVGSQSHSTGMAEMDWFISDRWETPIGFDAFYSERLWRMPDGYACYSPPAYAPDIVSLPALHSGHITFGCFNNLAKVTPRVIEAWAEILRAVPHARLVLKCHQFNDPQSCAGMVASFVRLGIAAERINCRGGSRHRALLAEYGDIDIVLDPFPYTGGLTTCEALWMGVPTVCLAGETFASRHSTSHMSNVGLADWSTDSVPAYIRLAIAKAADIAGLAALRKDLRARVASSPLCDSRRFGRHFGEALHAMWEARSTTR